MYCTCNTEKLTSFKVEMPPPTTPEKSGGKPRPGGNEDLIPLVIASHPGGMSLNYKRMKELDPQKRTYYALEHKFRKFKARAKEICDAEGGKALDVGKASVEKAGAKSPNNQHEDLIPLLIASIPGRITLNFNRMKELDPHGRTASSLEHKFRKYKAAAKEILDADGGKATEDENSSVEITPTKKRKTKGEGVKGESDNEEMTPTKKRRVVKRDQNNGNAAGVKKDGELADEADRVNHESAKKKAGAKASDEESEDAKLDAAVAKKRKPASAAKSRPRKKGLAVILKKETTIPSESDSADEEKEDSVKATTARPKKPLKKGLARTVRKEATSSLSERTESEETEGEEHSIKAKSARNGKRKAAVGVDVGAAAADRGGGGKTKAANDKKSSNGNELGVPGEVGAGGGGAIAEVEEVGETSGVPSKESAIRLLFE